MWQSAAAATVGAAFGLGGQAASVLDAAIGVEAARRQFVKPKPNMPRPFPGAEPRAKRQRLNPAQRAVTQYGHYKGDFSKTKVPIGESSGTLHAFHAEAELFGNVKTNDCLYLGVQSVNLPMIARGIAIALIRHIWWREFKTTLPSGDSTLFENTSLANFPVYQQLILLFRSRQIGTSVGVVTEQLYALDNTKTLSDLADAMVVNMLAVASNRWGVDYEVPSYSVYAYQFQETSARLPPVCILDAHINVDVVSVIHLQNTTPGDNGGETRDGIHANPLMGKTYTFKGRFPQPETNAVTVTQSAQFFYNLNDMDTSNYKGGMLIPLKFPTAEFRAPPNPQMFSNIISCSSGLRLEPGDIKKDVVKFNFRGRLNDLLHGLAQENATVMNVGTFENVLGRGELGTCKYFALEKVVPTGPTATPDRVEINYHVDRYIHIEFSNLVTGNSIRNEFSSKLYNVTATA